MKLEQIEQILSLSDTGSFTETARRLYISQPNLSASVKQLENEIGNIIFERTPLRISGHPIWAGIPSPSAGSQTGAGRYRSISWTGSPQDPAVPEYCYYQMHLDQ